MSVDKPTITKHGDSAYRLNDNRRVLRRQEICLLSSSKDNKTM